MHHGKSAKITVPPLHRVLFGVSVAAKQLHGINTDFHGLLTGEYISQVSLAVEVSPALSAAGGSPVEHAHRLKLDSQTRQTSVDNSDLTSCFTIFESRRYGTMEPDGITPLIGGESRTWLNQI